MDAKACAADATKSTTTTSDLKERYGDLITYAYNIQIVCQRCGGLPRAADAWQ